MIFNCIKVQPECFSHSGIVLRSNLNYTPINVLIRLSIAKLSIINPARFPYPRSTPSHHRQTSLCSRCGAVANPRRTLFPPTRSGNCSLGVLWNRDSRVPWIALIRSRFMTSVSIAMSCFVGLPWRNSVIRERANRLVARIYRLWQPVTWHTYSPGITSINLHDTHPPIAYFTTQLVFAHPDTHPLATRPWGSCLIGSYRLLWPGQAK